jgi:hypothetical protein
VRSAGPEAGTGDDHGVGLVGQAIQPAEASKGLPNRSGHSSGARLRKVSVCYGKLGNSNSVGESKGVSGSLNPQATVSSRAGKGQQGGSDNSGDDNLFNEVRVYLEKVLFV